MALGLELSISSFRLPGLKAGACPLARAARLSSPKSQVEGSGEILDSVFFPVLKGGPWAPSNGSNCLYFFFSSTCHSFANLVKVNIQNGNKLFLNRRFYILIQNFTDFFCQTLDCKGLPDIIDSCHEPLRKSSHAFRIARHIEHF